MLQVLAGVLLVSDKRSHPHSEQVSLGFIQILSLDHLNVNTSQAGFVVFSSRYCSDVIKPGNWYLGGAFPGNRVVQTNVQQ